MPGKISKLLMLVLIITMDALLAGCGAQASPQVLQLEPSSTFTLIPPTRTLLPPTHTRIPPTDTPIPPTETPTPIPPTPTAELPFTMVRIIPHDGNLDEQLAAHVQQAYALSYTPVLMFDASW